MPVYLVEMWIPMDGKERECLEIAKKVLEYIKTHRDVFGERKSHRLFCVFIGDKPWYIDVQEYEDFEVFGGARQENC